MITNQPIGLCFKGTWTEEIIGRLYGEMYFCVIYVSYQWCTLNIMDIAANLFCINSTWFILNNYEEKHITISSNDIMLQVLQN